MTGNFSEAGVPGKIQFGSAWWFNDHIDGMEQQMVCAPTKIAPTLANDQEAIKAAIKTCNILDFTKVKMVRIKNTLEIGEIEVSAALHDYVKNHPQLEVLTESAEWIFDKDGNLTK